MPSTDTATENRETPFEVSKGVNISFVTTICLSFVVEKNGEPCRTLSSLSDQHFSLTNRENQAPENKHEIARLANARKPSAARSAMSRFAKRGHKKVARSLGFALTLATPQAWLDLSAILALRLTKAERAGLAYSALISMDADDAHDVASLALFGTSRGGGQ